MWFRKLEILKPKDTNVYRIYFRIVLLAILVHSSYVVIFAKLSYSILSFYNIFSCLFYCTALWIIRKNYFRTAVVAIHCEVSIFVIISTVLGGWTLGIPLYLMALASLVYFCPFRRRYIPYLFSLGEIIIFFLLKIYTTYSTPFYPPLPQTASLILYIYNSSASFAIILYAAFLSNLTASVNRKELHNVTNLANYDQLTGLLSRHYFFKKIEENANDHIILVLGDIDDFKKINDTYGHICGDHILRSTSALMKTYCGEKASICRWGGEEFIFLFHSNSFDEVSSQIQTLCDAIANYVFQFEQYSFHVTMTFGVCAGSMDEKIESLIDRADQRLYIGKANGKNCVVVSETPPYKWKP